MKIKSILITTLLAGSLDITAACISAYIVNGATPGRVLKYIASGAFGKSAFNGGYDMIAWGLLFHYIIAFSCTAVFFWFYPRLKFLSKNIFLNSILIALVAWAVTTLVVMPLSELPPAHFTVAGVARAIIVLIFCIGLPISWMARKYYRHNSNRVQLP
ncbi:MAG: hypothetical protein JST17_15670 [Bacteroidetes bacterium]|nr:hypothetical protein [Bacteroidota bacterium]MBS1930621.1 hypothetical protein [Bacteroidota bacterium]